MQLYNSEKFYILIVSKKWKHDNYITMISLKKLTTNMIKRFWKH